MAVPEKGLSADLYEPGGLARAVDEIANAPAAIVAAASGLTDAELRYKPSPEKWSALEILAHLADIELVYGFRLRQIIAQPYSTLAPVDQDAWSRTLGYGSAAVSELMERYVCLRRANVALLRRLTSADLRQSAFHPEYDDSFTLADLVTFMRRHDPNHLAQIERLKQQAHAGVLHGV
ncbi:MAG: DinB family protein [Acidobacteria bacterium]|nr:DinB family protein [Acidobacteriota bacterium]